MNKGLLGNLLAALFRILPDNAVAIVLDHILDKIEDLFKNAATTPNPFDDAVLHLCKVIRNQLNIPDNDEPPASTTTAVDVTVNVATKEAPNVVN